MVKLRNLSKRIMNIPETLRDLGSHSQKHVPNHAQECAIMIMILRVDSRITTSVGSGKNIKTKHCYCDHSLRKCHRIPRILTECLSGPHSKWSVLQLNQNKVSSSFGAIHTEAVKAIFLGRCLQEEHSRRE